MSKTRTFVAIDSDDALRSRATGVVTRLRPHAPTARWVDSEGLHLTLLFLGELGDQQVADVCSQVEWIARANAPFSLGVKRVGAFPAVDRPRAIWLGVEEGREEVQRLHEDLADALGDLVPRQETRAFVPHWTLARLSRRAGAATGGLAASLANLADHECGRMPVNEITVFSSELHPSGPEYYAMSRSQLGVG